jgi:hypothetical protein
LISPSGISYLCGTAAGDDHAGREHVNRARDTPSFCTALDVLDISTLGDEADVNPVIKFLTHTLQHLAVDSSDCLHHPLSQLWYITWHRGYVHTILDITPIRKNHWVLGQVTVEAREEEEGHCQKRAQSNDRDD